MSWQFVQEQVLGMKWLHVLTSALLGRLGLNTGGRVGGGIHFFVYDVVKITILLCCQTVFTTALKALSVRGQLPEVRRFTGRVGPRRSCLTCS